jgi:hypothetical protein
MFNEYYDSFLAQKECYHDYYYFFSKPDSIVISTCDVLIMIYFITIIYSVQEEKSISCNTYRPAIQVSIVPFVRLITI